jgi:ubiquinone/menaquinone biosynthesis C-methylase UbiE
MVEKTPPRSFKVIELLKSLEGKVRTYLDVGCGDGSLTSQIAEIVRADQVFGCDISEEALKMASLRGIKTSTVDINNEPTPFINNYFDLVTACEVIEHLVNPDKMLTEVYRVLKTDGYFLLSTPNLASGINRILILFGFMPYLSEPSLRIKAGLLTRKGHKLTSFPTGHLRLYTLRALKELLAFYDFKIIKVAGSRFFESDSSFLDRILTSLDGGQSIIPSLASHLIVLAKKGYSFRLRNI